MGAFNLRHKIFYMICSHVHVFTRSLDAEISSDVIALKLGVPCANVFPHSVRPLEQAPCQLLSLPCGR